MTNKLLPYNLYEPVVYDYLNQLPTGWKLLPNIAIFEERIDRGHEDEELLSITIGKGVIKQTELDKKDSSTLDKSKYLLVYPNDLVYSMRFRQGASGFSNYLGIVSPACTVLKPRKNVKINPRFFHYMFRSGFYKNYVERYSYGIADGQIPLRYTDFKRMYSIVPPIETQDAIVDYLDLKNEKVEAFIGKKEILIKLFEEQKNSVIWKLVKSGCKNPINFYDTGIEWIGQIPEHWELKPFFSVFQENKIKNDKKEDYPVLSLSYGKVIYKDHESNFGLVPENYDSYQIIYPNQIVFRFTDLQNDHKSLRVGLARNLGIITSVYLSVKLNSKSNLHPEYAYFLLHSYDISKVFYGFGGGVRQAMGYSEVKHLPILIPPMEEQLEIIEKCNQEIENATKMILNAEKEITILKDFQESLITEIITGRREVT